MHISHNDPVKNVATDKPKPKVKKQNDEINVTRETTIKIKEEFKFSSRSKTGEIPTGSVFEMSRPSFNNPLKVSQAKTLVDYAVELDFDDKAGLVKKSAEFSKSLNGMNTEQLVEVADYIRHLMQETSGTDDILGGLQEITFNTIKNNISTPFTLANISYNLEPNK